MSMGLFNWHPKDDETVVSEWWWVYFAVAGGLTAAVFVLYFWWSWFTGTFFPRVGKAERHMV